MSSRSSLRPLGLAIVLAMGASAACDAPQPRVAAWVAPAAAAPPEPEAMYLEMNQGDMKTADALLQDLWPARGHPDAKLSWPLTWTEDPYEDAYFRFMFYSLRHTEHLLWAFQTTHDRRYLDKLLGVLDSYVAYDATRAPDIDSFDNAHAASYRAMVLTNVSFKLQQIGELSPTLQTGIRDSLQRLGVFLMRPKSFEGHANHGFTEAAALLVVAHNFPDLDGAASWRATGIERLEQMRVTNIDADGVDIENSPFYHLLVLGLVAQIGHWSAQYEPEISEPWKQTEKAMLRYVAYVTQPDGALPMLGATQATTVPSRDARLFGPLAALDPEYAWVWSGGKGGTAPAKRAELFPVAGLFVLRAEPKASRQTFVTFDSGSYRTDHSHLDAQSVTIYSDGVALFPDGGLCTYDVGAEYDYFHGTRSHNTVVVDGKDQGVGDASPGAYGVTGKSSWATGISNLYAGVTHRRTVIVVDQSLVLVTDDLTSDTAHDYTQTWHVAPSAHTAMAGFDAKVTDADGAPIGLILQAEPEGLTVESTRGASARMQGWVSEVYGKKLEADAIEYNRRARSARFATLIATGARAALGKAPTMRQSIDPGTGERTIGVCAYGADDTIRIAHEGTTEATVTVTGGGGC